MSQSLYDELLKQAEEMEDVAQEFEQPEIHGVPSLFVKQPLSQNAPDDAKDGEFYDRSGFYDPMEKILATYCDSVESAKLRTKYDLPEPHTVCMAPIKRLKRGIPFVDRGNGTRGPGTEDRLCDFCPRNRVGNGTPKLPDFDEENLQNEMCKSFYTWEFLMMEHEDDADGTAFLLHTSSAFFMDEYQNMPRFVDDGVLYCSWEDIQRQIKRKKIVTPQGEIPVKVTQLQQLKFSIFTAKFKFDKGVAFLPVFGIVGIWTSTEQVFKSIRNSREMLPLNVPGHPALTAAEVDDMLAISGHVEDAPPEPLLKKNARGEYITPDDQEDLPI